MEAIHYLAVLIVGLVPEIKGGGDGGGAFISANQSLILVNLHNGVLLALTSERQISIWNEKGTQVQQWFFSWSRPQTSSDVSVSSDPAITPHFSCQHADKCPPIR